ncbi:MAG: hypothetical protein FJ298_06280 [Planctomycetes bacterium]|nr:hypothetical protein [Planctomycetota bacterium]
MRALVPALVSLVLGASACERASAPERAPVKIEHATLDPSTWVGRSIHDSDLARWTDTRKLPTDALWVLYRVDCDHCREHLRELARGFADAPRVFVLLALRERGDEQRAVVDDLPPGERVDLPDHVRWHATAPWELEIDGEGVVRSAVAPLPR